MHFPSFVHLFFLSSIPGGSAPSPPGVRQGPILPRSFHSLLGCLSCEVLCVLDSIDNAQGSIYSIHNYRNAAARCSALPCGAHGPGTV